MTHLQTPSAVLLALILGFFGLSLVFSDLGPNESWQIRLSIGVVYFFLCGLGFGFAFPNVWPLAALIAWGGLLFGGFLLLAALKKYGLEAFAAQEPPSISPGLVLLAAPLGLALV
ncbi:MAG: hypothetical protein PSX80_04910, partial [bacterium]|nr:hypothetical protein [bacterium]